MSMPVRAMSNERDERRSIDLIRSLSEFTKEHRAAHWTGTFAELPRKRVSRPTRAPSRAPATSTCGT